VGLCVVAFTTALHFFCENNSLQQGPTGPLQYINQERTPDSAPTPSAAGTKVTNHVFEVDSPRINRSSLVHDSRLAALCDSTLKVEQRISTDIAVRIPSVSDENDFLVLNTLLADPSENDTIRNEVANLLRRSSCPNLTTTLLEILNNRKEKSRFRSFAVQHLWHQIEVSSEADGSRIIFRLRELSNDQDVEVNRESLLALVRMKDPIGVQTAEVWLTSINHAAHRDLAIRCAYELDMREKIPLIRDLLRDTDEVVRIAAIVVLSQWGDGQSRVAFEEASKSPIMRVQRAGKAALDRLDNAKTSVHLNLDSR